MYRLLENFRTHLFCHAFVIDPFCIVLGKNGISSNIQNGEPKLAK